MTQKYFFAVLLSVVLANYAAQVPYYLFLYYFPHHSPPSLLGSLALGATLLWFLVGCFFLKQHRQIGYYLVLSFVVVEGIFYFHSQLSQFTLTHQLFLYVIHPKTVLFFVVFGIGYLNGIADIYFMYYLITHKNQLVIKGT